MSPWHIWQADVPKRTLGAGTGWGVSRVWMVESILFLLQNPYEQASLGIYVPAKHGFNASAIRQRSILGIGFDYQNLDLQKYHIVRRWHRQASKMVSLRLMEPPAFYFARTMIANA